MVYSHWLGPEPGPGQGPGPVLCRTFHIAQGLGRMDCMVLIRTFHTAPEQGQGRTLVFITGHIFPVPVPVPDQASVNTPLPSLI